MPEPTKKHKAVAIKTDLDDLFVVELVQTASAQIIHADKGGETSVVEIPFGTVGVSQTEFDQDYSIEFSFDGVDGLNRKYVATEIWWNDDLGFDHYCYVNQSVTV